MPESAIFRTNISPNRRMVLISHGFLETGEKLWIKQMTAELLKHSDLNVIVINWGGGSAPPYSQAVANTRVIGTMAAHLINYLDSLGIKARDCHAIGHSLGSHVAAYIGQVLRDKFHIRLARISALDPAEPHFTKTNPIVRLDPTDADFVDVIHTDAAPFMQGGLGLLEPVGHVDFYPNGGVHQPGCNEGMVKYIGMERGSFVGGLQKFLSCNHIRSYQYYIESINTKCPYMGISCDSWEQFQNGSCFRCATEISPQSKLRGEMLCTKFGYGSLDDLMHRWHGTPLKLSQERLFLMTNSGSPFCQEHYRVSLHISGSAQSVKHGGEIGMFWVTLLGENGSSHRMQLTPSEQLYEPDSYHRVVVAGRGVGKLRGAFIEWEYRMSFLNPLSWRVLGLPKIYLESISIDHLEGDQSIALCVPDGKPVISSEPILLHHRDSCTHQYLSNNRT
ncbi:pancreatic triacylglycerol lipase isoform X2 [Anabrus simplex]